VKTYRTILIALICVACAAAAAADFPRRKPGQWQLTTGLANLPPTVERVCLDAAVVQLAKRMQTTAAPH
jgi:hypothetical protein